MPVIQERRYRMSMVGTLVGDGNISLDADLSRLWDHTRLLMLIRLFQQNTTYSVRMWRGLRFHIVCANSSDSSLAKRPVRSIWPSVAGLTDLSVRDAGTCVRTS